jgi:hypothetical protein
VLVFHAYPVGPSPHDDAMPDGTGGAESRVRDMWFPQGATSFCRGTTHARFGSEVERKGEQSCGSFARQTVSGVAGTAQNEPINAALALPDCRPWFSKAACCKD